jgi:pSer/pThr/pTyr-binding forkhead associated (FHA) protein
MSSASETAQRKNNPIMSAKSEKLAQRIQEVQRFAAARISQEAAYSAVTQELVQLSDSFKTGKLNIQSYSRFPILAQALQNFFCTRETLPDFYQFKIANLPKNLQPTVPTSPATLILQSPNSIGQQQTRYPLSTTQKIVMGRRPGCEIQIPDQYTKVGGYHAEIEPLAGTASPTWQICDLNSRNGTFINGQKLQGCQLLQPGDKITLAYASTNEKSLEFLFDYQTSTTSEQEDEVSRQLTECDVLCLVVNPSQLISAEEQQFLEKVSKAPIGRLIVVVDTSGNSGQVPTSFNNHFLPIKSQLQAMAPNLCLELCPLLLCSFYPNAQVSKVESSSQIELDKFCESLEREAMGRVEEILLKRTAAKLLSQLTQIERILDSQESALNTDIKKTEAELQRGGQSELKEQTRKAIKKANDEKDKFFRQVKIELTQSKADLLDGFRKSSIIHKIKLFTDNLKPVVNKKGRDSYIQLFSESTTNAGGVTNAMTHLCRSELFQWGTEEWKRICTSYAEGGLRGLFQRTYTTLKVIPSLELSDSLLQTIHNVDIERSFQVSVADVPAETRYKEISLGGYIFKNLRSQVTAILGSIVLIGGAFGLGRANIPPWLSGIILVPLSVYLTYSYQQDKSLAIEEEGEKIKDKLRNYYRELAKNFVDKIVQSFNMKLEAEERRLREAIDTVNEQFAAYLIELEKSQLLVKNRLTEYKARQDNLKKEKAELEKFKRI